MKENYHFELLGEWGFVYFILDEEALIGLTLRLDNRQDLMEIHFTEDKRVKDIEVTYICRAIETDSISINKENIVKEYSLSECEMIPHDENFVLNDSNDHLKIILSVEDPEITSYYEDGTMTYYFNKQKALVMLEKALGKEEKGYFDYIHSPLPVYDPNKVIEEIAKREGIHILDACFLGDESWEEKMVNSYYHLRFIYDDQNGMKDITYPYETHADMKGVGVRELIKRLEEDDLEAYEMLHSGYILFRHDYINQIRIFARNNIHYNNILRKYLKIQKDILKDVKEGDIVLRNTFLQFIRRTQLMREIECSWRYPSITYDYAFDSSLPYLSDLTSLKDTLLADREKNPLITIDYDMIELMKYLTNYTVPEGDPEFDIAARDALLAKADDL